MTSRPPHRAFTLAEMLVALMLATFAAGIALSVVARQQRVSRGVESMMSVREPVRDVTDLLSATLRTNSVVTDTLQLATDTAVEFFMSIGASTLCVPSSGVTLSLPPDTLVNGAMLTSWLSTPDSGDYALVFHDSGTTTPMHVWERLRVQKVTEHPIAAVCPTPSPFITPADLVGHTTGYTVTLATPPSSSLPTGTPVRFVRRGRYSVYRASDRQWYLGYRRCNTTCDVIQPVSGPYQSAGTPPLTLRYYASDGSLLSPTLSATGVARIDMTARAESAEPLQLPGLPTTSFTDTALTSVAFRNRQ